jgi:hypothetical protein
MSRQLCSDTSLISPYFRWTRFIGNIRPTASSSLNDAIDVCIAEETSSTQRSSSRQALAAESASAVYNRINPSFTALVNVKELNIEEKKSKNEKRKNRRSIYKKTKQTIEAEWAKTDIVR